MSAIFRAQCSGRRAAFPAIADPVFPIMALSGALVCESMCRGNGRSDLRVYERRPPLLGCFQMRLLLGIVGIIQDELKYILRLICYQIFIVCCPIWIFALCAGVLWLRQSEALA